MGGRSRRSLRAGLAGSLLFGGAVAAVLVPAVSASSASGGIPQGWSGPASYQPLSGVHTATPFDSRLGNNDYNGGPVMPSNTDYLVFWSPGGYSAYGAGATPQYVSGLKQYFANLAHDNGGHQNTDSVATQYNDSTGAFVQYQVTFGGALLDTDPYPTSRCPVTSPVTECLTDSQIQTELEKVALVNHVPTDVTHELFLLTPPHVEGCFSSNPISTPPYGGCSAGEVPSTLALYCAYHSNTRVSPMLLYSVDPYVTGNNGCDDGNHPNGPSDGALEGGLSHEHNESISDPIPNDAWTNGGGANQGSEIGDQCEGQMGTTLGTAPNGAKYNQVINGHFYWYQEEWSDQLHTCLQRFTLSGAEPTAKFTATAGSGLAMTFNAAGSTAPGGIADYVWQFNAVARAQNIETTASTITYTFPAAGTYSVGLTIYGHNGTAIGAGGIVSTGQSGFNPGFTFSPKSPAVGHNVTFSGLTSVSQKPVVNYLWEFGDGTTGSGANPIHAYAKAGTYRIELVMFSGVGSAWPGAGAGPIATGSITVR